MPYQVTPIELPRVLVARKRVRTAVRNLPATIEDGFRALARHVAEQGATPAGPPQVAYPGDFVPEGALEVELLLPVDRPVPPGGGVETAELPAGVAARTYHRGPYDAIGAAYDALFEWIAAHGRRQTGPPREIYLTGPDATDDPATYLTEMVVPLDRGDR
ncbi:hypothetical protein GCM10010492_58090 [Saccharothrix mutabilis subsp. mutabilis]|uniref:AraC effector-binding domain-containing protein n=1 Tax=Saccharothrix mutabilis subsp. mutabilis TaxID=66855 RepID=A0ABN0UH13_9PSEU